MSVEIPQEWIWIVVVGFIIAFLLCLGIGANDVANTFGTSVGAKVLTLRQACILATIFEIAGAVLLGAKVSKTIRKGIIDISPYENDTERLLLGNVAALSGSGLWMMIATIAKMPVSTTHSIVGATVGFALVANGASGINWWGLGKIVLSWFLSPVLSGIITVGLFLFCRGFILKKRDPLEPGLKWLPLFYSCVIIINVFSVFYKGPEMFHFDRIPLWGVLIMAVGMGALTAILVRFLLVPWQRKRITKECEELRAKEEEEGLTKKEAEFSNKETVFIEDVKVPVDEKESDENKNDVKVDAVIEQPKKPLRLRRLISLVNCGKAAEEAERDEESTSVQTDSTEEEEEVKDRPETGKVFSFLQILTAIFGAFAHGGNDVSNGIGPLISIWLIATTGDLAAEALTPVWILAYGGVGISLGLWIWGRRVIQTMGSDLTTVTPSSGFCIEIGSAMTVLFASNLGIPISSTHCKVGSIVFVGRARSRKNVDWSLFRNIVISWVVTLPACMAFSAAIMACLQLTL